MIILYVIFHSVGYGAIATDKYTSSVVYVNGTFESSSPWRSRHSERYTWPTGFGGIRIINMSTAMKLDAADYIELWTAHNSGSTENAEQDYCYFGGFKLAGV